MRHPQPSTLNLFATRRGVEFSAQKLKKTKEIVL
jgi:hypothetical protein